MTGLNIVMIGGNLGADPEKRVTPSGQSLVRMNVAVPFQKKVGDQWVDAPRWIRITVWGKDADFIAKYAQKGSYIVTQCELVPNQWTDKDGTKRYELVVQLTKLNQLTNTRKVQAARDEAPTPEEHELPQDDEGPPIDMP